LHKTLKCRHIAH